MDFQPEAGVSLPVEGGSLAAGGGWNLAGLMYNLQLGEGVSSPVGVALKASFNGGAHASLVCKEGHVAVMPYETSAVVRCKPQWSQVAGGGCRIPEHGGSCEAAASSFWWKLDGVEDLI